MYLMNDDYFDGFSVLFTDSRSVIDGNEYPLGFFAVELLELDRGILRKLERAVAAFKKELTVFLSARDATSAALAQQAMNSVWELFERLPVYRELKWRGQNARHLFRYMREHPEETDDMLTEGTGRSQMLRRWLRKLDRFTESIAPQRDTEWMLDEYFEPLTSRRPEDYARAYATYRHHVSEELRMRQ